MTTASDPELLRFAVIGEVDDGKSTLIGRILFDCRAIPDNQLRDLEQVASRQGESSINLAWLTDGLRAEREQGITVDVAYRYFSTSKRKFIIVDCPGHAEYTRNMISGISNVDSVVLLIDATAGLRPQTFRHSLISSLMNVKNLIVCINKLDLVQYSQQVYERIKSDFEAFIGEETNQDVIFIPTSALTGVNIALKSDLTCWYQGKTLLETLENLNSDEKNRSFNGARLPVQWVIRHKNQDGSVDRGYSGRIESGVLQKGDVVQIFPSGCQSKISRIDMLGKEIERAFHPMSVSVLLEDDIDLSRGGMIVKPDDPPQVMQDFDAMICWLSKTPLSKKTKYYLKHTTSLTQAVIKNVVFKMNVETMDSMECDNPVVINDIAKVSIRSAQPVFADSYQMNKSTGSLILIDQMSKETVAAGMICP